LRAAELQLFRQRTTITDVRSEPSFQRDWV
jgi:hypothetical protein